MSFNVSSIAKGQQWRNDLLMKQSDPIPKPTNEIFKEPSQQKYPGHPVQHSAHPGPPGPPVQLGQLGRPGHAGHPGHASHGGQGGQQGRQMLTNASVCCEQPNCNRAKIEQMPQHYFQEQATPFTLVDPAQGHDSQPEKKEPSVPPSDLDYMYSQHSRGGQLVTICCTGRNCDNATKIDEGIHMGLPEVHMCPPDVQLGSPDAHKGTSEEKRVKSSYNQYKY